MDKQSTERLLKFICAAVAVEPQAFAKLYRVEEWRPVQVEGTRRARDLASGRASCEAGFMKPFLPHGTSPCGLPLGLAMSGRVWRRNPPPTARHRRRDY